MTTPSNEKRFETTSNSEASMGSSTSTTGSGSRSSRSQSHKDAAGVASVDATPQLTNEDVFERLVDAVSQLEASGKTATAAGVSARMRLSDPGFSMRRTAFASFRELTKAAEAAGLVLTTPGGSDFTLSTPAAPPAPLPYDVRLRRDLWRAFHSADGEYAFDRETSLTVPKAAAASSVHVPISAISAADTARWMNDFAGTYPDNEIRSELESAVGCPTPQESFLDSLSKHPRTRRDWNRFLRLRTLEHVAAWAEEYRISRESLLDPASAQRRSNDAAEAWAEPGRSDARGDDEARRRVLAILESMPLHELLRLPIPLEYSLTR